MSLTIRKRDTGEIFDIPTEFKLEIRNTSPFFNDLGSKTITTNLPKTSNNIKLFDISHRLDICDKPRLKTPVIVSCGSYTRNGVLYESSAYNTENTFGVTIAFDEGIMYESMSDILLTELSNLPIIQSTVTDLFEMLQTLFTTDDPDERLSVFYLHFKKQTYQLDDDTDGELYWTEYVNCPSFIGGQVELLSREQTFVVESNKLVEIGVPYGYGATPFVRVWYLLELVFGHFGYTVEKNPFKDDFQLKRLCVLNNTIDAIVTGTLDYKQLLPPVSISDFLKSLYCRFGLKVSFDSNTNVVNLVLLKDIFNDRDNVPLDLSSLPDIDYTSPKQLKLSVTKNLDESDTETETYEEFLAKYNNTIGHINDTLVSVKTGGIHYDDRSGQFYQCSTINQEKKRISSIHFDWNKKDEDLEIEEISSPDEALTMIHDETSGSVFLYYGLSSQLMNSILSVDGTDQDTNTENVLAFAYDMGEAYFDFDEGRQRMGFNYGSIFPYAWQSINKLQEDKAGNQFKYALTLTGEYGAFNQFFKEYDAFLRHSNHTVKVTSFQNFYNLSIINFSDRYAVNNQPLLLDKVDYDLNEQKGVLCTIEARTLRLYNPYDLDKDQYLPVADDLKYKWELYSDQEQSIKNEKDKISESDFFDIFNDPLFYQIVSFPDGEIIDDPNPPGDRTYWFLPPTEYQYQNEIRTGSRTHSCKVRYILTYEKREGSFTNPKWISLTETFENDVKYNSWFEAEILE